MTDPYQPVRAWEIARYRAPRRGLLNYQRLILDVWSPRGARSLGIYNRRRIRGGAAASTHAVGRGLDIGASKPVLDEIAMRLIDAQRRNRLPELQEVIYNRQRSTSAGTKLYRGSDDHRTHIHLSLTIAGADTRLRSDLDRQRIFQALFPR